MDAVSTLHSSHPPIIHRDLKLENLLMNSKQNGMKLCDFGSATTETHHPNINWTMNQVFVKLHLFFRHSFTICQNGYEVQL